MNGDHPEDNLLIVRAFGAPDAEASEMIGLDENGGNWRVTEGGASREMRVEWPSGAIAERPEIRREVVYLYREACVRLGVDPRPEESAAPNSQGHHGHGHGEHGHGEQRSDADTAAPGERAFSQEIRSGTRTDHSDSEAAAFMASIMRGTATRDDYAMLVAQHFFVYEALEAVAEKFADDPLFAPFHDRSLARMAGLEADLRLLFGEQWRETIQPTAGTAAYAARIREVGAERWVPGFIAHHYTRYLGDLSGGQMIAQRVAQQHGFVDGQGVEFYDFTALGSIADFKERYRGALDELGRQLDDAERARTLDEVRAAYQFNTQIFADLALRQPQSA